MLYMRKTETPDDEKPSENSTDKSRSQKKRESSALQNYGEELSRLSATQLAEFDLPDELKTAIEHLHGITKYEARRRQMQYLGRLVRELDDDALENIIATLTNLKRNKR
jgi:ribosome-associated protein